MGVKAWRKIKTLFASERGWLMAEYLVALLILGGVAISIATVLTIEAREAHNSSVQTIQSITSSGF